MPRPIWKGHISFGLVSIPIRLYPAEDRSEMEFHMLDRRNRSRVRYERINDKTGKSVPWDDIVKGYEYEKGRYVVLTDEDFKKAAVEATQTVEIESFVDRDDIDPVYFERPYYLVPEKAGQKGYFLLLETLRKTKKVAVARIVIRTREYLAVVFPDDGILVLDVLRYQHELRSPADLDLPAAELKKQKVTPREVDMAVRLVESMSGKWEPEKYKDEYREALLQFVEKKAKAGGKAVPAQGAPEKKRESKVIDIMELLRRSMEKKGSAPTTEKPRTPARAATKHGATKRGATARGATKRATPKRRAVGGVK